MAAEVDHLHCVGGPYNGSYLPHFPGELMIIGWKTGKYIHQPAHYPFGECWVWHKFIH